MVNGRPRRLRTARYRAMPCGSASLYSKRLHQAAGERSEGLSHSRATSMP